MNDLARQKLIDAALRGVRQIKGRLRDSKGGMCALGALGYRTGEYEQWMELGHLYEMKEEICDCPFSCGLKFLCEGSLIVHLNDKHDLDFLGIANKL